MFLGSMDDLIKVALWLLAVLHLSNAVVYKLDVHTKDVLFAGTNEYIEISIIGVDKYGRQLATPRKMFIDYDETQFERNKHDILVIDSFDVEDVVDVEVRVTRNGLIVDNWHLDSIRVTYKDNTYRAYFDYVFTSHGETQRSKKFFVECAAGYNMETIQGREMCRDKDECKTSCRGQGFQCQNFVGSYRCSCKPGYKQFKGQCVDVDECESHGSTLCPHPNSGCVNTFGSYKCICNQGYTGHHTSCKDFNECINYSDNQCSQRCENLVGSYKCKCDAGYQLGPDKKTCVDLDECQQPGLCDPKTSVCFNKRNGYLCICKDGYEQSKTDPLKCVPRMCHPLSILDVNVIVSPPACTSTGLAYQGRCSFSCNYGHQLHPTSSAYYTCGPNGQWVGEKVPTCFALPCPIVFPPSNGDVIPGECRRPGVTHGKKCYFSCEPGFKLIGPNTVLCSNKAFDKDPGKARCVRVPEISCPDRQNVYLPKNKNTVQLGNAFPSYRGNMPPEFISISPPGAGPTYEFPEGSKKVTYTAANEIGEKKECSFFVNVYDNSPPAVEFCPPGIYLTSRGEDVRVKWEEPRFTDNTGVVNIQQTARNDQMHAPTSFSVHYTAIDKNMNSATCSFNVAIKVLDCSVNSLGGGDQITMKHCMSLGQGQAFCSLSCMDGKTFNVINDGPMKSSWKCSGGEIPGLGPRFPDCVDFIPKTGNECPPGYMPTEDYRTYNFGKAMCGKCPRGTYYELKGKKCVDCPKDTHQDQEGQLDCKKCPIGTGTLSTRNIDGKSCKALCQPGTKSTSGLSGDALSPCTPCPKDTYSEKYGSTVCTKCDPGTHTKDTGTNSKWKCYKAPVTYTMPSGNAEFTKGKTQAFDCFAYGIPAPQLKVVKENQTSQPSNHKSEVTKQKVKTSLRYIIVNVSSKDAGRYRCTSENEAGENTSILDISVVEESENSGSGSSDEAINVGLRNSNELSGS